MADQHQQPRAAPTSPAPPPPPGSTDFPLPKAQYDPAPPPPPPAPLRSSFDPSRMIGIIKRKALIKKLAAVYHAECLSYCQQLLELQNNSQEPFVDLKAPDDSKKETAKPTKRSKKSR